MRRHVLALGLLALIGSLSPVPTAGASTILRSAANLPTGSSTAVASKSIQTPSALAILASPDYALAGWIPAASSNFTVSDRPASYQVNMIVIHDIEGSYSSAVTAFQNPSRQGSAHYVISRTGRIAQMVLEKDIAWHAGNWDYNTRSIGIEHEGFAGVPGSFTLAEYRASAKVAASICSRWGVPMDRKHVIGHYQVPDPNNPALGGGADHHTDPGPYWNWTYYMDLASRYARYLPSLPHMGPDPAAASAEGGITLSWQPAQSCTAPITGYSVVGQPGNITLTLAATTTSVWIPGLTDGVGYSFTVTAHNAQGQSSLTSNTAVAGPACTSAALTANPGAPQPNGTTIQFTATSTKCNSPEYAFWVKAPGARWSQQREYGAATWTWSTVGLAPGIYQVDVWARQKGSRNASDAYAITTYSLGLGGCQNAALAPSVPSPQVQGTKVTFMATSTGCTSPQYRFWLLPPGGSWISVQAYGASTWLFDSSKYSSGNFQVSVWARQTGAVNLHDSYVAITYWIHVAGGCVVTALDPSVASPQVVGASVKFTPQQSGCTSNQYKFWLLPPGGSWRIVQAYGVGSTWTWNTATYGPGFYEVSVWEGTSTTPNAFESNAMISFTLLAAGCGSASLSASVDPPQRPGTTVAFTASATGCAGAQYQFGIAPPGGAFAVKRTYGAATWSWDTAGLAPGTYQVVVWAREAGSTAAYEAYFVTTYQLTVVLCDSVTITASPPSPKAAGTPVTFAAANTSGCASPNYEFWEQMPSGAWKLVQSYRTGTTFGWTSTSAGSYTFAVWAVATGSYNAYDSYALTTFVSN